MASTFQKYILLLFVLHSLRINDMVCHSFSSSCLKLFLPNHSLKTNKTNILAQKYDYSSSQRKKHQTKTTPKSTMATQPKQLSKKEETRRVIIEAHRKMLKQEEEELIFKTRGDSSIQRWPRQENNNKLKTLKMGDCLTGQVHRIVGYGAWINIGSLQNGFLHRSEMRESFVTEAVDTLTPGQEIKVYVKHIDAAIHKLTLTRIPPMPLPTCWTKGSNRVSASHFEEDEEVFGLVTKITSYGAYVDIGAKSLSFLHFKDYPPRDHVDQGLETLYSRGDRIVTYVKHRDVARDRVALTSRKRMKNEEIPEDPLDEDYQKCYHRKQLREIERENARILAQENELVLQHIMRRRKAYESSW